MYIYLIKDPLAFIRKSRWFSVLQISEQIGSQSGHLMQLSSGLISWINPPTQLHPGGDWVAP